jgi:hypothetical protein
MGKRGVEALFRCRCPQNGPLGDRFSHFLDSFSRQLGE